MAAFELETVGSASVTDGLLTGSNELLSRTTIAVFEDAQDLDRFIRDQLGSRR